MVQLLCSGPRFSSTETKQLSTLLYRMQDMFTGTQLCVPKHFDVCINFDRIWEFTYVKRPNGNVEQLDMMTNAFQHMYPSTLAYFSGNLSEEYYVFGPVFESTMALNEVERNIRNGPFICFDGEPELDKMMQGDFTPLQRADCSLRFNEVFRWAWESWRTAVGIKVGEIFPQAADVMNVGARNNGVHMFQ